MMKKQMIAILILGLILQAGMAMAVFDQTDDSTIAEKIDKLLNQYYKPDEPGAAVIAVKKGKVVFRKTYGMADMELGVRMEPEMVFAVGSATKSFTALAVLMLAERGKLSLDDEITKFLPDYPTQGQKITIRHLLSHTSGIKRLHSMKTYFERIREDISKEDLIGFFKDEPMEFAPGDKFSYCNSGYHLLGLIIEKVSGQSYEQFMKEIILDRLGMTNTHFASNDRIIPNRVKGYHKEGDTFFNAPLMSYFHLFAAGDLLTNVDDLIVWDTALYSNMLVGQEVLKQAFAPFILNNGKEAGYGLGWFVDDLKGRKMVYHGGGIYGYIAHIIRLPEEQIFVALLSNRIDKRANPPTQVVAEMVAAIVLGDPFESKQRKVIALSSDELEKYAGTYKASDTQGRGIKVIVGGGKLYFDNGGGEKYELLPESKTTFFIEGKQSIFIFSFDDRSQVKEMVLNLGGEGGRKMIFRKE